MTQNRKTPILVIDDEPDEVRNHVALGLDDQVKALVVHPREVEKSDLKNSDLVLVDYKLEEWSERDAQSVSLKPATGLALAVVLREQVDRSQKDRLTAFALHTGHLGEIQGRLPSSTAQHVLARMSNLEWVFSKTDCRRFQQMTLLANAVQQLPKNWPPKSQESVSEVRRLLGMDESFGSIDRCWQDILECRVPINDLTEGGHGILFVRWLLHEILPYPSFLWSEYWVAARLGITAESLREVVGGDSLLARDLKSMSYTGILAGFLGDRWWRGILEDYVWELANQCKAEDKTLQQILGERARLELESIGLDPALVSLDTNLEPSGQFLSPMTAVALRPDHWPTFADTAWMDIEAVRDDSTLQSMVDPLDLHRVRSDEGMV